MCQEYIETQMNIHRQTLLMLMNTINKFEQPNTEQADRRCAFSRSFTRMFDRLCAFLDERIGGVSELIEACQSVADRFWHSKLYFPVCFLMLAVFMAVGQPVIGGVLVMSTLIFLLLFCDDLLSILFPVVLLAMVGGGLLGAISGLLKSYCNVNEVISGIMLNWIVLYLTNMLLTTVKEAASPYTIVLANNNPSAVLPSLGLGALFNKNQYVGLAIPLSIVMAILIWIVLDKTRFGYELKATGFNRNAAKYCGMAEKRNVILSLVISGALAGMGAALLYLTGYEQWQCSTSSVPAMGFNGIAAAFLGGLNPLGTVLASFFIQHITAGGAYVDKSLYCAQISDLISSIIIYLCGFVLFMKHVMNSSIAKREEKAALKAKAAAEQDAANGKGGDQA